MSWNNIPNNERLHLWKTLREDILVLPIDEQLVAVAQFFAGLPYGHRLVDYYTPLEWPTPWEILYAADLCKSSISILMFYTFSLLSDDKDVKLHRIDDGQDEYLIVVIDDQFVLNYQPGAVNRYSDVSDDFTDKQSFAKQQIKKIA